MIDFGPISKVDAKLARLLALASRTIETCGRVCGWGVCPHPDNDEHFMHVCKWSRHWPGLDHKCSCGKEWTEVRIVVS